jgi:predicted regulator of Ras-like GTPase activity (Roadblock/LC7/MglB family)
VTVPFQYLLTNLLVDVPGAQGAIFMDPEGEAIDFVTRRATPYELRLEGAYHGIFLRRAGALAKLIDAGELERLSIRGRQVHVISKALRAGYYLVLLMEAGAPPSVADAAMRRTAEALDREIP